MAFSKTDALDNLGAIRSVLVTIVDGAETTKQVDKARLKIGATMGPDGALPNWEEAVFALAAIETAIAVVEAIGTGLDASRASRYWRE